MGAWDGGTAPLWICLNACLCLSAPVHLCRMPKVPTSALRGHIPILRLPRDPTYLTGIKLQGLGT